MPSHNYLERHFLPDCLTSTMRAVTVSWLVEVACEFQLQQETLFLAVALFDRYLSLSKSIPRGALQLVAVACVSIACKQEEVRQPSADEFAEVAANSFKREDLVRTELIIMEELEWRARMPTAYTFSHFYCYGINTCTAPIICLATYLVELSLLEYSFLSFPYSKVAAAALYVAHLLLGQQVSRQQFEGVTTYQLSSLHQCATMLADIHRCTCYAGDLENHQPLLPVREKYAEAAWYQVALVKPLPPGTPIGLFC